MFIAVFSMTRTEPAANIRKIMILVPRGIIRINLCVPVKQLVQIFHQLKKNSVLSAAKKAVEYIEFKKDKSSSIKSKIKLKELPH